VVVIPNASIPAGSALSFPFGAAVGNPVFISLKVIKVKGRKVFLVTLENLSSNSIFGEEVLMGLSPKQVRTGRTVAGAPALAVFLPPGGVFQGTLPLLSFTPVFVAGV
jgi:hypothetical protein